MGADLAAVVFGLASALSWGAGDFGGGLASRRGNVFGVVALSQAAGLLLLVALALLLREPFPSAEGLAWGASAGVAGGVGVLTLYRALAVGQMGIAAPITAVLAAASPVVFGALVEGAPAALQLAGFVVALVGVWFLSRPAVGAVGRPKGLGLALVSGLAIGAFLILLRQAGTEALFWPLAAARVASLTLVLAVALVGRRPWLPTNRQLPLILVAGLLDMGGNTFFVLATQVGRLDVAAVVSSLYPASTVILARLVLQERITRWQAVGVVAALVAVVLIAA